jgi:hypothetical protein
MGHFIHVWLTLKSGFGFKNIGKPDVDWGFKSPPQPNAEGRSLSLPR